MSVEKRIDDLINAGWHVLETDFDATAFMQWRKRAVDCLNSVLGPDHTYTRRFKDYANQKERKSILAAKGVLSAARETVGEEDTAHESALALPFRTMGTETESTEVQSSRAIVSETSTTENHLRMTRCAPADA